MQQLLPSSPGSQLAVIWLSEGSVCLYVLRREDPEVLLEERQQLKTDIEDQLEEVGTGDATFAAVQCCSLLLREPQLSSETEGLRGFSSA